MLSILNFPFCPVERCFLGKIMGVLPKKGILPPEETECLFK